MVTHAWNPRTKEVEAGDQEFEVLDYTEFKISCPTWDPVFVGDRVLYNALLDRNYVT